MSDSTPPSAHAANIQAGEPAMFATSDGVWKIPAPITIPTVIIVTSQMLKVWAGASSTGD